MRIVLSYIIGVWLKEEDDAVDQPADAENTTGKQVQNTGSNLALVEFVGADKAQKQTEEECYPFFIRTPSMAAFTLLLVFVFALLMTIFG